jgi:hypothetical protein
MFDSFLKSRNCSDHCTMPISNIGKMASLGKAEPEIVRGVAANQRGRDIEPARRRWYA